MLMRRLLASRGSVAARLLGLRAPAPRPLSPPPTDMKSRKRERSPNPYHPEHWGIWLLLGCLRLVVLLPFRAQLAIGRVLGRAMWHLPSPRRRITRVNLK